MINVFKKIIELIRKDPCLLHLPLLATLYAEAPVGEQPEDAQGHIAQELIIR